MIHISFSVIITVLLLLICLSIKEVNHERIRKTSFGRLHFCAVLDSRPDRVYQATALMQDAQQEEFIYVFAQYVLSADFDKRCAILFQNDAFNRDEISEYAIAIAYSYRSGD